MGTPFPLRKLQAGLTRSPAIPGVMALAADRLRVTPKDSGMDELGAGAGSGACGMHLSQRFRPAAKPRLLRPGAAPGSPRGRNAWRRRKKAPPAAEHSTVQQEESREPGRFRAPLRGSSEPEPLVAETPLHTERQTFLSSLIIFNSQPVADSQR